MFFLDKDSFCYLLDFFIRKCLSNLKISTYLKSPLKHLREIFNPLNSPQNVIRENTISESFFSEFSDFRNQNNHACSFVRGSLNFDKLDDGKWHMISQHKEAKVIIKNPRNDARDRNTYGLTIIRLFIITVWTNCDVKGDRVIWKWRSENYKSR